MAWLDNIFDYRYNPFTGVFSANPIGYSGNPVEDKTIPATSPYFVYLDELPREDSPSSLVITGPGGTPTYTEVSKTTAPAAGQFRVIYGGDGVTTSGQVGQGIIEFHSSDAGNTIEISYYGLGSILQKEFFPLIFKNSPEMPDGAKIDGPIYGWFRQASSSLTLKTLCAMQQYPVLFAGWSSTTGAISMYQWKTGGGFATNTWIAKGSSITVTGSAGATYYNISPMSATRVCFIDSSTKKGYVYDFSGSSWSLTASTAALPGTTFYDICGMTNSRVAIVDGNSNTLTAYDISGATLAQVGNQLTLTSPQNICRLSDSSVAVLLSAQKIGKYSFDGTNWTLQGVSVTDGNLPSGIISPLFGVSENKVYIANNGTNAVSAINFDGTNWTVDTDIVYTPGAVGGIYFTLIDKKLLITCNNNTIETVEGFGGTNDLINALSVGV